MFDFRNEKYWWGGSPTDTYTYRLNLFEAPYQGTILDYWNPVIVSTQTPTGIAHELQFEYKVFASHEELGDLHDSAVFKQYLADIIVEVIHRENGTLTLNFGD